MVLPVIANTVRVAVRGHSTSGQAWVNVLHFRKTSGSVDAAAITALDTEVQKLYGGASYGGGGVNLLNNTPATTYILDVTYTPLDGSSASTVKSSSAIGSGATDLLPGEAAPIMSLRTASRGRRNRGRFYLPALHEGSNDIIGGVSAGVVTAYTAQMTGFLAALTGINWQMVVASYVGSTATTVTTALLRTYFGSQKRRRT